MSEQYRHLSVEDCIEIARLGDRGRSRAQIARALAFDQNGWGDYVDWQTQDCTALKRIILLIADVLRDPFAGIGKPEQLKHILSGVRSRRIDEANRLVYFVTDDQIVILQAREHY